MLIERDGYTFHIAPTTPGTPGDDFWTTFWANGWEHAEQRYVFNHMTPGTTFVDIGAWVGPWTLPALARGYQVDAYEPDPAAYRALEANLNMNRRLVSGEDYIARPFMVAPDDGDGTLTAQADIWGGSMSGRWATGTQTVTVPRVTVSTVLDVKHPFVKVDIEGDELDVFPAIADHGAPCHVSLHAPLARLAGDPVDYRQLRPAFKRYRHLTLNGHQRIRPDEIPYDNFCAVTCLDPR